jgi:hypothetical protein
MTYELAKQLKDAGFPLKTDYKERGIVEYEATEGGAVGYYEPTLSELIEACGDRFVGLDRFDGGWKATGVISNLLCSRDGSVPEEAVGKLWLALNTK